jgi:hypothetical protein
MPCLLRRQLDPRGEELPEMVGTIQARRLPRILTKACPFGIARASLADGARVPSIPPPIQQPLRDSVNWVHQPASESVELAVALRFLGK